MSRKGVRKIHKRTYEQMKMSLVKNPRSLNLYRFIRLVLGEQLPDRYIARKWDMDEKNFHEFKTGEYPVPRLEKVSELSSVLKVNKHLIFEVAEGVPAQKAYELVKNKNSSGQLRLMGY
jgi:hypothetical protein